MDTSKEYIKMCEKAEEIQKEFIEPLDFLWSKNNKLLLVHTDGNWRPILKQMEHLVWLPRQDQLQEMVDDVLFEGNAKKFYEFRFSIVRRYNKSPDGAACNSFNSMEQLCLAFVMKEKFGKIWNREAWVKQ